jgi:hypothetical protein
MEPAGRKTDEAAADNSAYYDPDTSLSDFWHELHLRGQDLDPVDLWLGAAGAGSDDYLDKFVEYWRVVVPRFLAPAAGRTSVDGDYHDESRVEDVLFAPINAYICGGTHAVSEVFKVSTEFGRL